MMNALLDLTQDVRGSAATEMALSLPVFIALMFGSFELGAYFLNEHKVIKAVRDGARYASRQGFDEFPGCTPSTSVVDETRNVTRTGQIDAGGTPRLGYWTDPNTITVTTTCDNTSTYSGIYQASAIGAPVVTVAASLSYTPMLGRLGLSDVTLELNARSQATVNGL